MKKVFTIISIALLITGSAFAKDIASVHEAARKASSDEVAAAFHTQLRDAREASKAGQDQKENENQLPIAVKKMFGKVFDGYKITQVIRSLERSEEVYYISAENEEESVIFKINEAFETSVFKQHK